MNQLFITKYIREITLKNGEIIKYDNGYGCIKYGIPDEKIFETSDWLELLHKGLGYVKEFEGSKSRKGIWCKADYLDEHFNRRQRKIYKDEFVKMKTYRKIRIVKSKDIRMKELVNQLSVEEYILFLKDNEIKYITTF